MGRIQEKIEGLLTAISFAEEGEFESARAFLKEERRVLLALRRGQVDSKTFRYALNTCKRVGAALDILYISPVEGTDPSLDQCLSELKEEGVTYRLIRREGCLKQGIIDYTAAHKEILFAITGSSTHLETDCKGSAKRLPEAWKNLQCPLVVVADIV